eukprot:CAMPEP_0173425708 /NCGR_PEP_ID=MMETSP1357-20121228/5354_1 /TAXON_ID=77926 /ORGANISM="Hemiselmis rufescens, Strain PCC563" /LENGTH=106 /DNA_ID=CAMNT_0014389213 /DNA_START=708 /DNA_END=1028 /DNA_ORIENTATION=-
MIPWPVRPGGLCVAAAAASKGRQPPEVVGFWGCPRQFMVASGPAAAKPVLAGLPSEHLAGIQGETGSRPAPTPPKSPSAKAKPLASRAKANRRFLQTSRKTALKTW